MDAVQLDMFAELEKVSDSRKANLCRSWKNAVLNEHGVYIDNRIDIDKYKTKKRVYPRITIHCALEYPKVYYSFDVIGENRGGGGLPGKGSRNFDVHEHEANVALMVEQALREKITDDHKIPEKMIREVIEDFKAAIVSDDSELKNYTQECAVCKRMIPKSEIFSHEGKEVCMDCWENKAFVDEDETNKDEGWCVCPTCKEKVGALCKSGLCVECDYKKQHPEAEKKICEDCIHFRYHDLYDENDNTSCCCKLHLEGKNRHEWTYLCNDFVKVDSVEDFDRKYEGLMKYASYKGMEKCEGCGKKFRFTYHGLCLPCYEKKRKLGKEIEQ